MTTINEAQHRVKEYNTSHGFDELSIFKKLVFQMVEGHEALAEIVNVLGSWLEIQHRTAKLVDYLKKTGVDDKERIGKEFADIFIYLLDSCNQLGISLEEAFRLKYQELLKRDVKHRHSEMVFNEG